VPQVTANGLPRTARNDEPRREAGSVRFMDGFQDDGTTYEERLGRFRRSSLQVVRWVLHELPSITGCLVGAVNLQMKHIMVAAPPSGKRHSLR